MTYILPSAGATVKCYAHRYNFVCTGHLARDIEALRQRRLSRREAEAMRAVCIEAEMATNSPQAAALTPSPGGDLPADRQAGGRGEGGTNLTHL